MRTHLCAALVVATALAPLLTACGKKDDSPPPMPGDTAAPTMTATMTATAGATTAMPTATVPDPSMTATATATGTSTVKPTTGAANTAAGGTMVPIPAFSGMPSGMPTAVRVPAGFPTALPGFPAPTATTKK